MIKKLLFCLFLCFLTSYSFSMSFKREIIGKWKVTKVQGYSPNNIGFVDINEKTIVGQYLLITDKTIEFKGEKAKIKNIEFETGNTQVIFYHGYNMNPYKLNLPKTITEISIDHDNANVVIYYILMLNKNNIVFDYEGIFFRAVRVK